MTTVADPKQEPVTQPAVPRPGRVRGNHKLQNRLLTVLLAVTLLALAEIAARREWVSDLVLPPPSAVADALVAGFGDGFYWPHIWSTLSATALGFALAAASAIMVAGVIASFDRVEGVLLPFIIAFQTLPKIAVAPLVVLWLGFGSSAKVFIVTIVCFFPILINTLQGLKLRDREQVELMKSLGATRWQLYRMIRMPNAVPYIFAGLHIGVIYALIGAVVAEFVGSRAGLGYILLVAKAQFNVPGVFAILFLLMLLGLVLHGVMLIAERRAAFWAREVSAVAP
jgi:NitT/TauT family transport system permease protein